MKTIQLHTAYRWMSIFTVSIFLISAVATLPLFGSGIKESSIEDYSLSDEEIQSYTDYYKEMKLYIDGKSYPILSSYTGDLAALNDHLDNNPPATLPLELFAVYFLLPGSETEAILLLQGTSEETLEGIYIESDPYGDNDISYVSQSLNFIQKSAYFPADDTEDTLFLGDGILTNMQDPEDTKSITFTFNRIVFAAGSVAIDMLNPRTAQLNGTDLGVSTYIMLEELIRSTPTLELLILKEIYGSADDLINMQIGRLVRNSGLNTLVESDSYIASGAVDLFTAGVQRIYHRGATVAVHSWCCGESGEAAHEIPKDDEQHGPQLSYFTTMLPETGSDFYFFTIYAAPFDEVHNMTEEELVTYKIVTEIVD